MGSDTTKEVPILRKRQQIQKANKNMFFWVAGAAVILGISIVLVFSLFERISYKQDVISEKRSTIETLDHNIEVASSLKKQVRVMNTNQALLDTPRLQGSEPLSVILDALPSVTNSSALGASLQQRLLNLDGLTIESLTVDPIPGAESLDGEGGSAASEEAGENEITFRFTVVVDAGNASTLQAMLRNLEKSIRTIDITSVVIEQNGDKITLSAEGKAFYQPAKTVQLQDKEVPKGGKQ